ncbi:MAG: GDSL-type esterase/lipase family protein [Bacteroides sp.]|nr:GDSL-type esterase/lipase family protein [Bacteroides sp.]
MPLSKWSNGKLSNVNLFGDVLNIGLPEETAIADMPVDPMLEEEIEVDTRDIDTAAVAEGEMPLIAIQPNKQGDQVVIEDYTVSGHGLENLRNAIKEGRMARIAIIGDSYIEGDIFAQDLREMLQETYGGTGVGYVNMHSDFPGFRRSVKQGGGKGWKEYAANGKFDERYMGLTQHYYKLTSPTTSTYAGSTSYKNVDRWNRSQFLFFTDKAAKITVTTATGEQVIDVEPSEELQALTIDGSTDVFDVKVDTPSLIGVGVWLTDTTGVNVDCMSSRGFSGVTLAKVNHDMAKKMAEFVDYDLIILEFGINAMSPKQTNFDNYSKKMEKVIAHVHSCFPNADILMLGIGDRGSKKGSEVHSMTGAPYMVAAQREAARHGRCLFWDTREAMGGEDGIVNYVRQGWANTDYIHLNHKGGRELATPLYKAIKLNLDK